MTCKPEFECKTPRKSRNSRCGRCEACKAMRIELRRVMSEGGGGEEVMVALGCSRLIAGSLVATRQRWAERGGAPAVRKDDDRYEPRPLCACGLSVDKNHTPATCDMRNPRSTGMGQWGALTW